MPFFDGFELVPEVVGELVCEEGAEEAFEEWGTEGAVVCALFELRQYTRLKGGGGCGDVERAFLANLRKGGGL